MKFTHKISWLAFGLLTCMTAIAFVVVSGKKIQGQSPAPLPEPVVANVPASLKIQRQALKASSLQEGMTQEQVEHIMGKPTDMKIFPNLDARVEILKFRREPMVTKVSMTDGNLSGVTIEVKPITRSNLPLYAKALQVGMNRQQVIEQMGQPLDERKKDLSIYQFEQLTFRKGNDLPINVLLRDGFVEAISTGLENPSQLLGVMVPAAPTLSKQTSGSHRIRIGMSPQQVVALFGPPSSFEQGEVQQQQVSHLIYSALNTNATTRLTFTNNVLTRFSFIPQSNLVQPGG